MEMKKSAKDNIWQTMLASPDSPCIINFEILEEHFAQPERKVVEKKEETKKKGPVLVALLDPKKSLAINLIIKNLRRKNDDIAVAITDCSFEKLNPDQVNGLLKIIPESTEVDMINAHQGGPETLAEAERFYTFLIKVPEFELRLQCMKFSNEFKPASIDLGKRVDEMLAAGINILTSDEVKELLHILLVVGNFINTGGYAGNACGFKLSLLAKIHEIKSNKPRMTMMHVFVESIEKNKPELLHFYKKLGDLTNVAKVENTENEKDLKEMTKAISTVQNKMQKLDKETIDKFEQTFKDANEFCVETQQKITEINSLEDRFRSFFILDKKNYSLQECFKVMAVFCTKFENAIEENKKRREQEVRLAKRKEEMARRDTLPKTKKQMKGLPPPEECVIDNLLSEIRGGLQLKKAKSTGAAEGKKVGRTASIKKANAESAARWRKSKLVTSVVTMKGGDNDASNVPSNGNHPKSNGTLDLHDASDELIVSDLVDSVKASSAEIINTIELDVIDVEIIDTMQIESCI